MSTEVRNGPSPEEVLNQAITIFRTEAESCKHKSISYFERHPDFNGDDDVIYTDGATYQRMAEVYLGTAKRIYMILLQYEREIERAMNVPYLEKTDEEMDEIIKNKKAIETLAKKKSI